MRRDFLKERVGAELHHVGQFSLDPASLPGNIENFTGVAQVPIGVAGPVRIEGKHVWGDFYIPLATTEGTLVASYNRGMRLLTECGGVRTTVVADLMQRAPVFALSDALQRPASSGRVDRRTSHRDQSGGRVDDSLRCTHLDRPVPRRPAALPQVQLHHGRCGRAEHDR